MVITDKYLRIAIGAEMEETWILFFIFLKIMKMNG